MLFLGALAGQTRAQGSGTIACDYAQCALNIAPRWNGLAVVRGAEEARVANLNFFWPRDISSAFAPDAGDGRALAHARRAVRIRRLAAAMTDVAVVGLAAGAVRSWRRSPTGEDRILLGASLATFVASVPLQFIADGALSRAVWWYNRRFGS